MQGKTETEFLPGCFASGYLKSGSRLCKKSLAPHRRAEASEQFIWIYGVSGTIMKPCGNEKLLVIR